MSKTQWVVAGTNMTLKLKKNKTKSSLALPVAMDAYTAEQLQTALLTALKHAKPLNITADKVSTVDTICCQLLLAGYIAFTERQLEFTLSQGSSSLLRAINRLGLTHIITGDSNQTIT